MATAKCWMVEQWWRLADDCFIPVRSVVEAKTKKDAAKSAAAAVRMAVEQMTPEGEDVRGEPSGEPVVMYRVSF